MGRRLTHAHRAVRDFIRRRSQLRRDVVGLKATHFAGCLLWLRAMPGNVVVASGALSDWFDLSIEGHDVAQSTMSERPLWNPRDPEVVGFPSVEFVPAANHKMVGTFSGPGAGASYTFVAVVRVDATNTKSVFELSDDELQSNRTLSLLASSGNLLTRSRSTHDASYAASTGWKVVSGHHETGERAIFENGALKAVNTNAETGALAPGFFMLGDIHVQQNTWTWDGKMVELAIWGSRLATAERQLYETTMRQRYAVPPATA